MRFVQITPLGQKRLFGAMLKKEAEIRKKRPGAFNRSGARKPNRARWKHIRFKGWIDLKRGPQELVTARISSPDWQLLHAFVGWLDRHFGDELETVNIRYR
jgi:hypothetical protein